jgi:hypothetical protein
MGPKMRKTVTQLAVAGLAVLGLALSSGAHAAFVAYSGSGSDTTFVGLASDAIDLGSDAGSVLVRDTLGLAVSSPAGTTVTAHLQDNLQIVQGCALAASLCTSASWFELSPLLSVGDNPLLAPAPTTAKSYDSGSILVATSGARSFRLLFGADFAPAATTGVSGTLSVTAIPEPGAWAMMLAGVIGIAGIARRRIG